MIYGIMERPVYFQAKIIILHAIDISMLYIKYILMSKDLHTLFGSLLPIVFIIYCIVIYKFINIYLIILG